MSPRIVSRLAPPLLAAVAILGCRGSGSGAPSEPLRGTVERAVLLGHPVHAHLWRRFQAMPESRHGAKSQVPHEPERIRVFARESLRSLPELVLVTWWDRGMPHSHGHACAWLEPDVWCRGVPGDPEPLAQVVRRLGLGARPERLTDAEWVRLVAFLTDAQRFEAQSDLGKRSFAAEYPYAPPALLGELTRPRVERLPGGGLRVSLHHEVRTSSHGGPTIIALLLATVAKDDSVQLVDRHLHRQHAPPDAVVAALRPHLRSPEDARGLHLSPVRVPVPGLWLVKGGDRHWLVFGDEVRTLAGCLEPPTATSCPALERDLPWLAERLGRAGWLGRLTVDHWQVLLEWIVGTRPLMDASWLEKAYQRPDLLKRFHPLKVEPLASGGVRLSFLLYRMSLVRLTYELAPGAPVTAATEVVAPPAGPTE